MDAQKQGKVRVIPANFYSQWRAVSLAALACHDAAESSPVSERFLQIVWHYQRLLRDRLKTLDGQPVRVLHPGFWNHEAGPDFRGAVVQIGSAPPRPGDIEIDLHPHFWKSHHHDQNPAYDKVLLHVVWEGESERATALPTLPIKPFLDSPWGELKLWLSQNPPRVLSHSLLGHCAGPFRDLPRPIANEILQQAAQVRFQAKAVQSRVRAQQVGWEQSLWEGLLGALGYKYNVWPMRRLGELLPVLGLGGERSISLLVWQARLLGVSGLLPGQLTGAHATVEGYLRRIWDIWWREQEQYSDVLLPGVVWRFSALRPANHPQRRLALAAHWLAAGDLVARLERWFGGVIEEKHLVGSLLEALPAQHDDLWSWHWTLRSARMAQPQPLLGPQRATDLAVNVILPWFWARAVAGKNASFQQLAERRFSAWPKAQDNAVLRLARQRLFGGQKIRGPATAAHQQGLLQIVRDFCDHSNALCDRCRLPEMVLALQCGSVPPSEVERRQDPSADGPRHFFLPLDSAIPGGG